MNKNYRIGVIGRTGRGDYGHDIDTVWTHIDSAEIVAVADEDEEGRTAAARRLKAPKAYADYRKMLAEARPQIVSVCPRWLDCHHDMVVACAEAGASVFLEKPICPSLAEADSMIDAAERCHIKVAIAHQTRYSPRLERIKELIAQGRLGDILEIRGRGKSDHRGGGEDLMVLGTHIMDLMRLIAGDARWCFARVFENGKPATKSAVRQGNEGIGPLMGDHLTAAYGFDNGIEGFFASSRVRHGAAGRFGLQIYGTKGVIHVETRIIPFAFFLDDPKWSPGKSGAKWQPITSGGLNRPEPLKDGSALAGNIFIVKDLIKAIEEDRQPLGSIYDGRAALEMILAVYESHKTRTLVDLPMENRRHPLADWQ